MSVTELTMIDDATGGSLPLGQRLNRIETQLVLILGKLEGVASRSDLEQVRARVELIEREGSPATRRLVTQCEALDVRIEAVERDNLTRRALETQRRWLIGVAGANSSILLAIFAKLMGVHF